MTDVKKRCALLQDVDRHTFVQFSQYAYIKDYIVVNSDVLLDFFMIIFTHYFSNETSIKIDDDEALSSSSSSLNYAQSKSKLKST